MKNEGTELYCVNRNTICLKCGHRGAIQSYGIYYDRGLGDRVDKYGELTKPLMEKYRKMPYMSHTVGFGGTIPWRCTHCDNEGLIDIEMLEGYQRAFISSKKAEELISQTFSAVKEVELIALIKNNVYVYFQSIKFDEKIMTKLIDLETDVNDVLCNIFEIRFIPSIAGKWEDTIGKNFKALYVKKEESQNDSI